MRIYDAPGWIQNERAAAAASWDERDELAAHALRKGYLWRKWDGARGVVCGLPRATAAYSVAELLARDVIGLYGWKHE